MLKTPVNNCLAGPAMDAAVAEALGWSQIFIVDDEYLNGCFSAKLFGLPPIGHPRRKGCDTVGTRIGISPFSTDIAAAWELAERFKHGAFFVGWSEEWIVPYCVIGNDKTYGDTVPLAICRAFLKANGIEFIEVPDEDAG